MSLKAIAAALGLSVTTVSRALNGYDDVASETRKRIEEEARRRNYRPNAAAQRLKTGRANAVGLIFPISTTPLNDSPFSNMLLTLDQDLAREQIDVLLLADKPQDNQRALHSMLRSRALDAVIVARPKPQDLRLLHLQQKGFRFLTLGRSDLPQPYAWFDLDNHAGSALAVAYCLEKGLTHIAWLGSNEDCSFVRDRRKGFLDAMARQGLSIMPSCLIETESSRRAGYQQTAAWLAGPTPPQAIITDCGSLGEGAALALQQAARLHGEQAVALVIYDGLPADSIVACALPTIVPAAPHEAGEKVAQLVLALVNGAPVEQLQVQWQPQLRLPGQP
ncbi:LacI family DNA-binding transcriptional regulator [Pantoea sp.]|uniref:LacI family DNA-binding transcriptional regulator n=2 Tax=Pantoea sp. TaxID=69393 RepID=UPI0028A2BC89|nr:LacI family DNA-binding transcriptional regulator [Pantoea sp.]